MKLLLLLLLNLLILLVVDICMICRYMHDICILNNIQFLKRKT